ncbi:MAG: HD-GYP domain-containing protein [Desulfobaccales bacterium]
MDEPSIRQKILSSETKTLHRPLGEGKPSLYTSISLAALIPGHPLTFNLYLKVAQKEGQGFQYVPFLKPEEAWAGKWQDLLSQKGIDLLYFLSKDAESVIAYFGNYLQLSKRQNLKVSPGLLAVFSEHLNLSIRLAFQTSRFGPLMQQSKGYVEDLTERMQRDPASVKLVRNVLYHQYNLYNHSLNLCLLGMAFMLFLKRSAKETRDMGLAGLFHDVGMTRIPQEILAKEGPLTSRERAEINQHPEIGYRLLSKETSLSQVPNDVLRLSLEHHENADGSGYPLHLPLIRQHPWTRIIRLLDSYESLTVIRPYRPAHKPFEAIKIIREARGPKGSIYDLSTLKNFISFLTAN